MPSEMSLRSQFPFFQRNALVYLDNAATTQKPNSVIDAMSDFYQSQNSNVHRSNFKHANELTNKYEVTRALVAQFIGAGSADNIIWTKGTTDSINLVASSWGKQHINKDELIVVLGSEHHANFVPWQQLAMQNGARFEVVDILDNGDVDLNCFNRLMAQNPKLVAMQHCSNALGNIHPIKQLVSLARKAGATTLVDGAQAVGHFNIDLCDLGCDFYGFSGHKMYGPTGIGVLYVHPRIQNDLSPSQFGGEMISHVSIEVTTFREFPHFMETGTPNIAGVIGLHEAIKFLQTEQYHQSLSELKSTYDLLVTSLDEIAEIKILGNTSNNIGVVSFIVDGETVGDVGSLLSEQNIAVRCGHHCAMPLLEALNVNGTVRVSLACYNTKEDIEFLLNALNKSIKLLAI